MHERQKEYDLSLLQGEPSRDKLLDKMRGKLANFSPPATPPAARFRRNRGQAWTWIVRVSLVGMIAAVNWLLIDKKDQILATMGYEGIPALPKPARNLSPDEQALYYAYALYDYGKLKTQFGITEYLAVDQAIARRRLDDLLPNVSTATLGVISGYAPVGFRSVSTGGNP